jgi:hypothetical protein
MVDLLKQAGAQALLKLLDGDHAEARAALIAFLNQLASRPPEKVQEERPMTRREFCERENMSHSTYYKLRRKGLGPEETRPPGMLFTRITAESYRKWHERMDKYRKSEEAKLERERRRAIAEQRRKGKTKDGGTA